MTRLIPALAVAATALAPASAAAATKSVDRTCKTQQESSSGTSTVDKGSCTGKPFGQGKITTRSKPAGGNKIKLNFTEKLADGTVKGTITLTYTFDGTKATYKGSGRYTGGTGAYADASGPIKSFTGTGRTTGRATIRMRGTISY